MDFGAPEGPTTKTNTGRCTEKQPRGVGREDGAVKAQVTNA